jgi:hypothetical protein
MIINSECIGQNRKNMQLLKEEDTIFFLQKKKQTINVSFMERIQRLRFQSSTF